MTISFSISGSNRLGDIHQTLADSRVLELEPSLNSLRSRPETIGLPEFKFERDTKKMRIFVGLIPLTRSGRTTWKPQEWAGYGGFRELADDISRSHPRVNIVSQPVWVGSLGKFQATKQSRGRLRFVGKVNEEMRRIMWMKELK